MTPASWPATALATWWEGPRTGGPIPAPRSCSCLCDGGGSNSASRYVFKEQLQKLADRLGPGDPRGALPAVLLEVQPDRAPAIPPCDEGVPRGDLPDAGDSPALTMAKAGTTKGLEVEVSILRGRSTRRGGSVLRGSRRR